MTGKRITAVFAVVFACLTLCGAGWFNTSKVVIDTENNYVYEQCTTDEVLSEFASNSKAAKEKYQGAAVLLTGKVVSVGSSGKNMIISGTDNVNRSIECTYDKALRSTAMQYKSGDKVAVYGRIIVNIFSNDIYLAADKITTPPTAGTSNDMYYLLDGTAFDKRSAVKESLHNGTVEYYVPKEWMGKEIRHSVKDENLGTMEGYQYVLNKLGGSDSTPESVFVCYFDNSTQLGYTGDAGETKLIEKAIVENILGSVGSFPTKKVATYYDAEYNYYDGVFKSALEAGEGYRAEFIFEADGEEGIVVVLYVYKEAKHVDDLLFLMRFLVMTDMQIAVSV